ncbi:Protein of unknown function, partial [Gryllus bimaculatus]
CVFDLRVLVLRQYSVTTRLRYGTSSGLLQIFSYISTSPWIVVKPDWPGERRRRVHQHGVLRVDVDGRLLAAAARGEQLLPHVGPCSSHRSLTVLRLWTEVVCIVACRRPPRWRAIRWAFAAAPLLLLLLLLGYSPLAAHAAAALPIDSREDTGVVALGDTHYGYEKENGHSVVFFVLKLTQRTDNVIEI